MLQSKIVSVAVILFCALSASAQNVRPFVPSSIKTYPNVQTHPDFAATLILKGITNGRTILFDPDGDLLVVARDRNAILAVFQEPDNSATYGYTTIISAQGLGLNHGLAYRDGYIYASSLNTLYRWPYTPRSRKLVTAQPQVVIQNITPNAGSNPGHSTRTVVFSKDNQWMYVSVGSRDNVDPPSVGRAKVRRFPFAPLANEASRSLPIEFSNGEVWGDGIRNAVALGVDPNGRLWEADNGPDQLSRSDLGGYEDNPAEEFNLLDGPVGKFYGYPYCFTAGNTTRPFLQDPIRGTQYSWPGQPYDDNWCRNTANNQPPHATIPSHSAPLNMVFLTETPAGQSPVLGCGSGNGAFPCTLAGHAFLALHGSWNANLPKGYKVSRLGFDKASGMPDKNDLQDIVWQTNYQTQCAGFGASSRCFRPAGVAFDAAGTMFVMGQETGDLIRVFYTRGGGVSVSGTMTQAEISAVRSVTVDSPPLISPSPLPPRTTAIRTTTTIRTTTRTTIRTTTTSSPSPQPTNCVDLLRQCGGSTYTGPTCCKTGTCVYVSTWYSQCRQ